MKAIVIGCSGSGKSYFSKALGKATSTEVIHIDMLFWNPDGSHISRAELIAKLEDVMRKDSWIIDGDYRSTLELRLINCDTVFFLDLPMEVCLEGVTSRRGKKRDDLPWVEPEKLDETFKNFVMDFPKTTRPFVLELLEKYSDRHITTFKTREEINLFIDNIQ